MEEEEVEVEQVEQMEYMEEMQEVEQVEYMEEIEEVKVSQRLTWLQMSWASWLNCSPYSCCSSRILLSISGGLSCSLLLLKGALPAVIS